MHLSKQQLEKGIEFILFVVFCFEKFFLPAGSVCLFKGDQYWKFSFPGSVVQDGYPRSSATDFLDCSDFPSASEELSLSLSPPAGRQEYREQSAGGKEGEDSGEKNHWGDKGRHKHRGIEDTASHVWTKCSCQNGASHWRTDTLMAVPLLVTWMLVFFQLHWTHS